MKTNLKYSVWILLLYVLVLTGCKDNDAPEPEKNGNYISATLIGNIPTALMKTYAAANGFGKYEEHLIYDVSFFRLIYKTTYKGQAIEASGLLVIPRGMSTQPALLSTQHGTMFRHADAPSNFPQTFTGFELFGAAGYITAIPDYIGFGSSKDVIQPFYDEEHAAAAVVDMLKAANYYLKEEKVAYNNNLFLLGYSEGGYVTLAAQKEIETDASHNLKLTAAAAGAGGYDLPVMLSMVASAPTYSAPSFLAKLLHAYNNTYNWNRPLSDFFQETYAAAIPGLLDGTKGSDAINAGLTDSPEALFNPTFYQNLQNPAGETALKQKLVENSFLTWVPKSPTRLYHGTLDEVVFFRTSETTYERLVQQGATNVELIPIQDGTHLSAIEPMMISALLWFNSLNN